MEQRTTKLSVVLIKNFVAQIEPKCDGTHWIQKDHVFCDLEPPHYSLIIWVDQKNKSTDGRWSKTKKTGPTSDLTSLDSIKETAKSVEENEDPDSKPDVKEKETRVAF